MAVYLHNVITHGLSGKYGKAGYFRQRNGRTYFCKIENAYTGPLSAKQAANNHRFREAQLFAQMIIGNPERKAVYASRARQGRSAYNEAISDAMHAPEIKELQLCERNIYIRATDNFEVVQVRVQLYDDTGELLEEGLAAGGSEAWHYHIRTTIAARIVITAFDAAANTDVQELFAEGISERPQNPRPYSSPHLFSAAEACDATGAEENYHCRAHRKRPSHAERPCISKEVFLHHLVLVVGERIGFYGRVRGGHFAGEETFLEKEDGNNTYRNGGIGDVKYGPEKDEVLAAPYRYPGWQGAFVQREVQHIYHFAMQETCVSAALRQEFGHIGRRAFRKYKAVEHAVDQVARSAG